MTILTCCPHLWLHEPFLISGSELLTPLKQKQHNIEIFVLPKEGAEEEKVSVPNLCVARPTRGLWIEVYSSSSTNTAVPSLLACTAPRFPEH